MGGNVRISSPFSRKTKLVAGNPVSGSSCPLEYDTLVLRPPGQAQMGQCEEVVLVLRDPSATTEPSKTSKPMITTQPAPTTTLEPATTIPQTTPTTLPPTPPPTGLTVLTMDGSTQQALLPNVQVRIIRPAIEIFPVTTTTISPITNSSMTNSSMANSSMTISSMTNSSMTNTSMTDSSMTNSSMTNSSTGNSSMTNSSTVNDSLITAYTTGDGLALLDIPLDEPVIVVASKAGYLETSFTYCFQPGVKNVLPILIHKHSFTEQFVWMSEEDHSVEFRHPEHKIPYRLDIPAGSLNVTDGSVVEVRFSGVHTSHPTELKEVPELIGATESPDGMKLTGLEAFSMAEVTVVNAETDDLVDVEAERRPSWNQNPSLVL
ncbi:mucin-6-like [Strongylocentrotus purpuratus]|uniref:Uncharacterized protein n=1 Tax=Strongylocentrotus purpuratus TaxID=7668 RepID=A0A7M7SW95_STRPU|nr:mucin-6-like [Strongylocentrotus purpuratus]